MKVREIMKHSPITVDADDALGLARDIMTWANVRHLPVLNKGALSGILSERDILRFRARGTSRWQETPVHEAMHGSPQTAHAEDSLVEVAARMGTARIGCLPVVELGKLIGLITVTDVLAAEVQEAMRPYHRSIATALDAMTPDPTTIHPEASILDAARRMITLEVRHLPVVEDDGRLVGMLSERDIRARVGDPAEFVHTREIRTGLAQVRVRDAMNRAVRTARPEQPVSELARLFADERIGALPVVDELGMLVGIVSYIDVLRTLAH